MWRNNTRQGIVPPTVGSCDRQQMKADGGESFRKPVSPDISSMQRSDDARVKTHYNAFRDQGEEQRSISPPSEESTTRGVASRIRNHGQERYFRSADYRNGGPSLLQGTEALTPTSASSLSSENHGNMDQAAHWPGIPPSASPGLIASNMMYPQVTSEILQDIIAARSCLLSQNRGGQLLGLQDQVQFLLRRAGVGSSGHIGPQQRSSPAPASSSITTPEKRAMLATLLLEIEESRLRLKDHLGMATEIVQRPPPLSESSGMKETEAKLPVAAKRSVIHCRARGMSADHSTKVSLVVIVEFRQSKETKKCSALLHLLHF